MMRAFAVLLLLAACSPAPDLPPDGTAYIEVSDMSGLHGGSETRVYANDLIHRYVVAPAASGMESTEEVRQGRPGLYADLSALVAAEGPALAAEIAATPDDGCMDAGTRAVSAEPPVGGFSSLAYGGCTLMTLGPFLNNVYGLIDG